MKLPPRLRHKMTGFTLIELMMTIVVVGIAAVPLSLLIGEHVRSSVYSGAQASALNLARCEMEKVNNMNYANIVNASFSQYAGYPCNVTRTVTFVNGTSASAESLKKITVAAAISGVGNSTVTLATYIAKNVTYGL